MPEAARLGDTIGHSGALAGLIGGTILGAAISAIGGIVGGALFAAGIASSCLGVGILLIGLSVAVGMLASHLGEMARDDCTKSGAASRSPCGTITRGSSNVFINGKPAAIATYSQVGCDKDGIRQMAEGSSSVFVNGYPLARVGDKTTCDAVVMTGSPNVFIGGGTKTTEAVTPEVPHWAYQVSDLTILAAGLISFGGAAANGPSAVKKLFSKIPGAGKIGRILCRLSPLAIGASVVGILMNPVEVVAGQKFLNDDDELDFIIEGELPLYWQRSYLSSYDYDSVLGCSWSLSWESTLTSIEEGILWRSPLGEIIPFPDVPIGYRCFCPEAQSWLMHTPEDTWEIRDASEHIYHYPEFGADSTSRLSRISDNVGNEQVFHYNELQQMVNITGSGKLNLHCDYLPIELGGKSVSRLTAVWQVLYNGSRVLLCRYHYNEHAQLVGVSHRDDHLKRQFGWHEGGLLAWHQDARGLRCDYQWEQTEEALWRVISQQTSEGAGYRLHYDEEHRVRTAQWYDGTTTVWTLNEEHQIIHCMDRAGVEHHLLWDEFGLPTGYRDADGNTRRCEWDNLGRRLSFTDGNGHQTGWQYQNDTDRVTFILWPDGCQSVFEYDDRGRLVSETTPLKQTTRYCYGHNQTLRPYLRIDARGGESRFMWNDQGQLIRRTDCSGQASEWGYDTQYRVSCFTNALLETTRYHYHDDGQLTQVTYPDDSTERMTWDSAGQLLSYQRNENEARYWEYNVLGQVVCTTDRLQRQIRYHYTPEGYLVKIDNANGDSYILTRDAEGRLTEEIRPDETLIYYEYNAAGLLSTERRMGDRVFKYPERRVHHRYDGAGNLIQRETYTDNYQYQWDSLGRLRQAERQPNEVGKKLDILPNTVCFEYDALGRITREQNGENILQFGYDELDNLTELTLPQGETLHWLYYGSGHLSAVRYNQQLITEFERDALHRETCRTQGALFQYRRYDPLSRCISQYSVPQANVQTDIKPEIWQGKPWRAWHYDTQDELFLREDHYLGRVNYSYDLEGRLKSVDSTDSYQEMFWYDGADNLLEHPQSQRERQPVGSLTPPGDRLSQWNNWQYEHDEHGNVISRKNMQGQRYRYDGDNRLTTVEELSMKVVYHYDALGRRISKVVKTGIGGQARYEQTDFVWHGLRLLQDHELKTGKRQTYCYESHDSYTPLACIESRGTVREYFWYHTDINGAPLEVTNEAGKIVWSGKYDALGKISGLALAYFVDTDRSFHDFKQNLRYAGQYFDKETGLHFNTYRYYAPEIGRFITPDPIGLAGGLNLYTYAPNPMSWIDPWGLYKGEGQRGLGKYHVFHEHTLNSSEYQLSDGQHFKRGNQSVYERMQRDPAFRREMQTKYPGVVEHVQPNSKGNFRGTSPKNMTWHHENQPGKLSLVDRYDHKSYHKIYHPDGSGGRDKWGGGNKCRK
ncbi:PAAR domain-containing protein [Photorhabdus bodei]|uniref:RHS repeat-associated core domain-containing protein n=1 Tax=Photorhabdus bodei TaxID=2029681 RepID=UPI00232C9EBF|nr:RHS repeat-associated core domain-containing protein [Photorhabdus bodei]MDB6369630.1 PAAR domain-containing protein [Photorhabdus bodei]